MDQVTKNSFEMVLSGWVRNSILFRDPPKWAEGLKAELAEIPKLDGEIRTLRLRIDVSIQSLLLDAGFCTEEIFELMRMPSTAIDIIDADGGLIKWKRERQNCQPSVLMTL